MTLKELFTNKIKGSGKSKNNEDNCVLLKQIVSSMQELNTKALCMNDSFSEEKESILRLAENVKELKGLDNITAAKMEQDILCRITMVSSGCDTVLSGGSGEELKKQLTALISSYNQRKALAV